MENYERMELLENAQDKINEAIELIREAVENTECEKSIEYYIIPHLSNWANGNNPYDEHIPNIIKQINNEE